VYKRQGLGVVPGDVPGTVPQDDKSADAAEARPAREP